MNPSTLHEIAHCMAASVALVRADKSKDVATVRAHITTSAVAFAHDDSAIAALAIRGASVGPLALIPGDGHELARVIARGLHGIELSDEDLRYSAELTREDQLTAALAVRALMRYVGPSRIEKLADVIEGEAVSMFGVTLRLSSIAPAEMVRPALYQARCELPEFGVTLLRAAA